tara:strand:- start:151 stop:372 length:222 start_codon:yes stop_codon:yes gene_type:complete
MKIPETINSTIAKTPEMILPKYRPIIRAAINILIVRSRPFIFFFIIEEFKNLSGTKICKEYIILGYLGYTDEN